MKAGDFIEGRDRIARLPDQAKRPRGGAPVRSAGPVQRTWTAFCVVSPLALLGGGLLAVGLTGLRAEAPRPAPAAVTAAPRVDTAPVVEPPETSPARTPGPERAPRPAPTRAASGQGGKKASGFLRKH
jgi:hypothetical protein